MTFKANLKKVQDTGLGGHSREDLLNEIQKRDNSKNPFPMDVFNVNIQPFLNSLVKEYDVPRSFIGLSLLSVYSSAIGTSYVVSTNDSDGIYLPVWACLLGMSSSGKSIAVNKIFEPLNSKQSEYDKEWEDKTRGLTFDMVSRAKIDTCIYRDSHIATLTRSVMPDNPKGVTKMADELLEWINGMNQMSKKEGTDEQFWLSSWNCTSFSAIRSGKQKFVIPRPFVNVIGGTQPDVLDKMFANNRATTGFIFRLLFATMEEDKMAEVNPYFTMPPEWSMRHNDSVMLLYNDLPVDDSTMPPRKCLLTQDAIKIYHSWVRERVKKVNSVSDLGDRNIQGGIMGKIKEYALRFSAILTLSDKAIEKSIAPQNFIYFNTMEPVNSDAMQRAIRLADYFFVSAWDVYQYIQISARAPLQVLTAATMVKMNKSHRDIATYLYGNDSDANRQKMRRQIKKWINQYPRVFGANAN